MSDLYCDICGKQPVRAQIQLEGAKMIACGSCARSGKILHRFEDDEEAATVATMPAATPSFDRGEDLVEDVGKIIRAAREKRGLSLEELGKKIKETESYLHAIENGRVSPSLEIAKKLEKELKVKLIDQGGPEVSVEVVSSKRFSEPTLGDILLASQKTKKEK